jgi:hypothetical protein
MAECKGEGTLNASLLFDTVRGTYITANVFHPLTVCCEHVKY